MISCFSIFILINLTTIKLLQYLWSLKGDAGYFVQVRDAGNLLTRAGFNLPGVDVDEYTVKYNNGELFSLCENCIETLLGNWLIAKINDQCIKPKPVYYYSWGNRQSKQCIK